ncbi:hypothetical protein Taro_004050 [Colocasia esculenta]|uniref:C2H2-type domain-containing protein n=1 Tax=Colocasia esculenta TaxID=4460 RepID=A0A843TJ01_COLES|nr:hypothetical protein [Colocasia esculenta]
MAETRVPGKPNKREPRQHKKNQSKQGQSQRHPHKAAERKPPPPPSWGGIRDLLTCKHNHTEASTGGKKCRKNRCSGALCNSRDSSRVTQRPETPSPESQKKWAGAGGRGRSAGRGSKAAFEGTGAAVSSSYSSLSSSSVTVGSSSTSSSAGGSFRGLHLRRLSGCYECHTVVDPVNGIGRDASLRTISPCPDCGEIFMKPESLELHQAVRHAVLELGPEDTSRNIVEIIFQSSWLKKQAPVCKIDRILKVNNTQKTISRFEDYRDSIRSKASKLPKKHPRCVADGNELLRFHCAPLTCSLGLNGSTSLCLSAPHCRVCSVIRDGFTSDELGKIRTMATSGRAHDAAQVPPGDEKRAMLVCRVIAGRVKKTAQDSSEDYDSISGSAGPYSNLDELFVLNPGAILPCFVVIYGGF